MKNFYTVHYTRRTFPDILPRTLIGRMTTIVLFSLNELIKLYPNFIIKGEYIIFSEELYFNYQNYLKFENDPRFGGIGRIKTKTSVFSNDLISPDLPRGVEFCLFMKYPFKDIYINSGIYVYNWMIKRIVIGSAILIEAEIKSTVVLEQENIFTNDVEFVPDGIILKF